MKRLLVGFAIVAAIGLLVAAAWRLWPVRITYFTDADAIHEPTAAVIPRDILWQPARPLEDILNSSSDDYEPRLSSDGLTLFFVRGKAGHNADIYLSRRSFDGWSEPQAVAEVNSEHDDLGPQPSADGQTLFFYSNREGGLGGYDLWMSRRGQDAWQPAVNLGPSVNSEFNDYGPALTADGTRLYFSSNRPQPSDAKPRDPDAWPATLREDLFHRTYDLYTAIITDAGFGRAEAIAVLNTPYNEGAPAVTPFGDFLYFASDRPGGRGAFDLYRSRRLRGGHEAPTNLGEAANTPANELDPALSMGGYALSFSSDRPGDRDAPNAARDYNLYQTTSREVFTEVEELSRPPIDWAAFWRTVRPNLLWALLALLLLLLMLALFRGMRDRRLSLMMKCLLASLAAHLLLMLLFNAWEVAASLGEFTKGRGGPIQVALASPGAGKSIAAQIRGALTEIQLPAAPMANPQRAELFVEPAATPLGVRLATSRAVVDSLPQIDRSAPADDSVTDRRLRPVEFASPVTPPALTVQTRLPDAPLPDGAAEASPAVEDRPTEQPHEARAAVAPASIKPPAMVQNTGVPINRSSISLPASRSLAHSPEPPETTPNSNHAPSTRPQELAAAMPTIANTAAQPELRLPADRPDASAAEETSGPLAIPQALAGAPRAPASLSATASPLATVAVTPAATAVQGGTASVAQYANPMDAADSRASSKNTMQASAAVATGVPAPRSSALALTMMEEGGLAAVNESLSAVTVAQPASVRAAPLRGGQPTEPHPGNLSTSHTQRLRLGPPSPGLAGGAPHFVEATPPEARNFESLVSTERIPTSPAPVLDLPKPTEELPPDSPYVQRFADDRMEIVERMGGSKKTEGAVQTALKWLAAHQSADGRWDADGFDAQCGECGGETPVQADNALTGLSLLCFLGAGNTHVKDGPYRDTVERGLTWLASRQKPNGDLRGDETMYSHGIAAIALSEAFAMTGDPRLRELVQRGVTFIDKARNRDAGGWRYDPGQAGDTSVLGWQMMALKSASMAGLEVSPSSFDAGKRWLGRVSDRRQPGRYAYQPGREATPSMTAEGMFVQLLLGMPPADAKVQGSVKYLLQHLPRWEEANTYYWYYAALALFQYSGDAWQQWNSAMREELVRHQRTDGRAAGSWDPVGEWADVGGRVYQTALCTLMLEVYYRYLPLYSIKSAPDGEAAATDEALDAIGTIRGTVTEASGGGPLAGAAVRLDLPEQEPVIVTTDADGTYTLSTPPVPEFFALSASHDGFVPGSVNVGREQLAGRTIEVDFALEPVSSAILVMEAVPDVHHLGDNHFDGTINSQFQKRSEGAAFSVTFDLSEDQLPPRFNEADVRLLAKGVQRNHRIVINGQTLVRRLGRAPADGSFGEFSAPFAPSILRGGSNTLEIIAAPSESDIDDFEFVNVQIRLSP